jgi:hypothetical protein
LRRDLEQFHERNTRASGAERADRINPLGIENNLA